MTKGRGLYTLCIMIFAALSASEVRVVISIVLKSRVCSVNFHLFGSILLLTKKQTLAGASLLSLGKHRWKECEIGLWVVEIKGFLYSS